jgi:hypothetical protein
MATAITCPPSTRSTRAEVPVARAQVSSMPSGVTAAADEPSGPSRTARTCLAGSSGSRNQPHRRQKASGQVLASPQSGQTSIMAFPPLEADSAYCESTGPGQQSSLVKRLSDGPGVTIATLRARNPPSQESVFAVIHRCHLHPGSKWVLGGIAPRPGGWTLRRRAPGERIWRDPSLISVGSNEAPPEERRYGCGGEVSIGEAVPARSYGLDALAGMEAAGRQRTPQHSPAANACRATMTCTRGC